MKTLTNFKSMVLSTEEEKNIKTEVIIFDAPGRRCGEDFSSVTCIMDTFERRRCNDSAEVRSSKNYQIVNLSGKRFSPEGFIDTTNRDTDLSHIRLGHL